jgi:WD40 repeat protein
LWNVETGERIITLENNTPIEAVAFASDGRQAVFGGVEAVRFCVWDFDKAQRLYRIDRMFSLRVNSLAVSPNRRYLVDGGPDSPLRLWDAENWRPLRGFDGHKDAVRAVVFAPNSIHFASGGKDKTIRIWGPPNQK